MKQLTEKAYNELMLKVQHQFFEIREDTSMKLQKIEELLELAVEKFKVLSENQLGASEEVFVNPFGCKTSPTKHDPQSREEANKEKLPHLKLNFLKFKEGCDAYDWLEDCEQYFQIFGIEKDKRVAIAGMHFEGVSKSWYQLKNIGRRHYWKWQEFAEQFTARFGMMGQELLYESFKQLKQTTTVDHYFSQFEKCMEQLKRSEIQSKVYKWDLELQSRPY